MVDQINRSAVSAIHRCRKSDAEDLTGSVSGNPFEDLVIILFAWNPGMYPRWRACAGPTPYEWYKCCTERRGESIIGGGTHASMEIVLDQGRRNADRSLRSLGIRSRTP